MKFRLVERFEEENNEIMKLIKSNFQVTKDPAIGGYYILPSGEAIKVNRDHADIDKFLIKQNIIPKYEVSFSDGSKYMDDLNCIRIRARGGKDSWINPYVTLPKNRPTEEQFETLVNWLDKVIDRVVFVHTSPGSDFVMYRENPDEVIKKIKRYYSSGKLYESINSKDITNYKKEKEFKGYGNFAFIDRDGNFIHGEEKGIHNDLAWEILANNGYKDYERSKDDDSNTTIQKELGWIAIRCDDFEGNKIDIEEEPSSKQYEALEKVLDIFHNQNNIYPVEIMTKTKVNDYSFEDYFPNDILNKIKEYYITGRLDEELEEMSGEYDSEGNELTKEQAQFFKNSKVRDKQGRLLVCYHGTNNEFDEFKKEKALQNFSVFGNGFYFLDNEEGTKEYGEQSKKCYLNMTNPLSWKKEKFSDYIDKYHKEYFDNRKLIDIASEIEKEGFDGLIWKSDTYIVFEPNKIKSVTNKTPTNSNNINEEIEEKLLYRTEVAYGSGERKLEDVIKFEIIELGNIDIPDTLLRTFKVTKEEKEKLEDFVENLEIYQEENKEKIVDICLRIIKREYPEAKYCLWLADKDVVKDLYDGTDETIDSYKIEIDKPISNLGRDGQLYLYTKEPQKIEEKKINEEL